MKQHQMKQLHESEIANITQELQSLLDSRVQKVFISEKGLGLEIFRAKQIFYLWFELDPPAPYILLFDKLPNFRYKKTAPMLLFLKAHLEGKRISEIRHIKELGRVLEFEFGYDNPLKIEIRLFPHGANAIASYEKKKISFYKVKEIKIAETTEAEVNTFEIPSKRSLSVLSQEWLVSKSTSKTTSKVDPAVIQEKEIQKKEKALQKTQDHLKELQNDIWMKLGNWLKENQSLKVPKDFEKYIDLKKSFSQNLQSSFEKAKKNQEKISGTLERIAILKNEIQKLKESDLSEFEKTQKKPLRKDKGKSWKGYRLELNEKIEVFVGKSAQENLNILRFAQSWDYWMHIKDYPGAHGIVRRTKNYEVSDEEFKTIAQFIASKSKKSAHFLGPNDVFDVLIAECRYVRPIKGDQLGRVNYSNERVLHCRMK